MGLNVSAVDKANGKIEKIEIKANNNRLSAEEIEKMVQDAEKFKDEDDKIRKASRTSPTRAISSLRATQTPTPQNLKPSKRSSKRSSTQSCRKSTNRALQPDLIMTCAAPPQSPTSLRLLSMTLTDPIS